MSELFESGVAGASSGSRVRFPSALLSAFGPADLELARALAGAGIMNAPLNVQESRATSETTDKGPGRPKLHILSLVLLVVVVAVAVASRLSPADPLDEVEVTDPSFREALAAALEAYASLEAHEALPRALADVAVGVEDFADIATAELARLGTAECLVQLRDLAIASPSDTAQSRAQFVLGQHCGSAGALVVAAVLDDADATDGHKVAALLTLELSATDEATDAIIGALVGQSREIRAFAAEKLANRPGERATRGLVHAARNDAEALVREVAVAALSEREDDSVTLVLIERLVDDSADVQFAAVSAIESLEDRRAIVALLGALERLGVSIDPGSGRLGNPGDSGPTLQHARRIALALEKLTGQEHGLLMDRWRAWIEAHRDELGPQLPSPF